MAHSLVHEMKLNQQKLRYYKKRKESQKEGASGSYDTWIDIYSNRVKQTEKEMKNLGIEMPIDPPPVKKSIPAPAAFSRTVAPVAPAAGSIVRRDIPVAATVGNYSNEYPAESIAERGNPTVIPLGPGPTR